MATAKYAARRTPRQVWRSWSRGRKVGAGIVAVILAGAAVAVAALLLRAPITGQGEVLAPVDVEWDTSSAAMATATGELAECSATVVSPQELRVNLTGMPGASCRVVAKATATADTVPAVVQGLTFGPGVNTALDDAVCGATIPIKPSSRVVVMFFTLPSDAAPGTYPASADAGLIAVDADSYDDGACPRT